MHAHEGHVEGEAPVGEIYEIAARFSDGQGEGLVPDVEVFEMPGYGVVNEPAEGKEDRCEAVE
jgi:hypothetical protein